MNALSTIRRYSIRAVFEDENSDDIFELNFKKMVRIIPSENWGNDSMMKVAVYNTETGLWLTAALWSGGAIEMKASSNKVSVHN